MIEFGKTLREAREAKGYEISQLAEITHIKSAIIEGLENENFEAIVAPIYGRGFVKLCCETLGLEPKPMVDEFMEILNGNRESHIRERAVPSPDPISEKSTPANDLQGSDSRGSDIPVAATNPPEVPARSPLSSENAVTTNAATGMSLPQNVVTPNAATGMSLPQMSLPQEKLPEETLPSTSLPPREPVISRYASPFHELPKIPTSTWRIGILALIGIAILAAVIFGLRALRHATAPELPPVPVVESAPAKPAAPVAKPTATKPTTPTAPAAPRTPQKIPSLYID